MKSPLLGAARNSDDLTFDALTAHCRTLVRYLNFQGIGMVLGTGCGSVSITKHSDFPEKAYQLGRSI